MRPLTQRTLNRCARAHPSAKSSLFAWGRVVGQAAWTTPQDVKATYGNASIINRERVVFNIHGNNFRLVVAIEYARQTVFIKWFGSHAEYDRINAATIIWEDSP